TAMMSIDRIRAGRVRLVHNESLSEERYDASGELRVLAQGSTSLAALLDTCFESIRFYALMTSRY
ncbi:MAG: hypothetical protein AAGA56_31290, partial [Myxococcota bacterium]